MLSIIFDTIFTVIRIIEIAALVSVLMSWIMPYSRIKQTLDWLLSPVMQPFRILNAKIMGRFNIPLDFSYFFFIIALDVVRMLLSQLYMMLL